MGRFIFTLIAFAILSISNAQAEECNNPEGVNAVAASLAVGLMHETGRLDAMNDLYIAGDRLALTDEAKALCMANQGNECSNTEGALSMQDNLINDYIDKSIFNAQIFRSRLKTLYQRQKTASTRPDHDPNKAYANPHVLVFDRAESIISCGVHHWFDAYNKDVYDTLLADSLQAPMVAPEKLCSQLIFVGAQGMYNGTTCIADNPYLDLRIEADANTLQVAIDPVENMVNFTNELPAIDEVIESCFYIDAQNDISGQPCNCNGIPGNLFETDLTGIYTCESGLAFNQ